MILKDDNWKELPKKAQDRVNKFIDWLKDVPRFKPSKDLKKSDVEKQIKLTLKCFWIDIGIEYRKLQTEENWASARASAWDSARDSARASARDFAWASAWASARASARDSVRAFVEVLMEDNKEFKKKYPNWAFKQLFKLREMGLYPVWVLKESNRFVVYVPPCNIEFPDNIV